MAKVSVLPTPNTARGLDRAVNAGLQPVDADALDRNPSTRLDLGPVKDVRVNRSAIERRAATLGTRRTVKKEVQAAWLLHAVKTIDLTTLSGDDTEGTVKRLCAKARQPISAKLLADLGLTEIFSRQPLATGAVCVYHHFVKIGRAHV